MSRWGDGIYASDSSLDFFASLQNLVFDDLIYWFSPEHIEHNPDWISEVITLIEILLIFEVHDIGSQVALSRDEVDLRHWQEAFLQVWDAPWNNELEEASDEEKAPPYHLAQYRVEHRHIAKAWFERLIEVADYWASLDNTRDLKPFHSEEKPPYFSAAHFRYRFEKAHTQFGSSFFKTLDTMIREIVYLLSEENRDHIQPYELDEVCVSIDIWGLLCEQYAVSPRLREQTVDLWLDKIIMIWSERLGFSIHDEALPLYDDVITAIDRLKSVARRYTHWDSL